MFLFPFPDNYSYFQVIKNIAGIIKNIYHILNITFVFLHAKIVMLLLLY